MATENRDAYSLILDAIDRADYPPKSALVEADLADRFAMSRTPIREALQRLETQGILRRDGRSLIVSSLSHQEIGELYVVRSELEGLAARLAAQHAEPEEIALMQEMVARDLENLDDPKAMSRANRRLHNQIHLASHNNYLMAQLAEVQRTMALLVRTTFDDEARMRDGPREHAAIVNAIANRSGEDACDLIRDHISKAYKTRLALDMEESE